MASYKIESVACSVDQDWQAQSDRKNVNLNVQVDPGKAKA